MRMAVRPCQTVPPHQQVPSCWIASITRCVFSASPNETRTWLSCTSLSTSYPAAVNPSAKRAHAGSSVRPSPPGRERPSERSAGPDLDAARPPRHFRRVLHWFALVAPRTGKPPDYGSAPPADRRHRRQKTSPLSYGTLSHLCASVAHEVCFTYTSDQMCSGRSRGSPQPKRTIHVHPGASFMSDWADLRRPGRTRRC